VRYGRQPAGPDATDEQGRRRPLSGSAEQIRADTEWLESQGVTEVFYDLNWDPLVGSPDVDPASAIARADEIVQALAP
jgi:hypothetical protein